jgi:hypothetical protein
MQKLIAKWEAEMILRISSLAATAGFAAGAILAAITGDYLNAAVLTVIAAAWSAITRHQWRNG